jgi:hypothetical protein
MTKLNNLKCDKTQKLKYNKTKKECDKTKQKSICDKPY